MFSKDDIIAGIKANRLQMLDLSGYKKPDYTQSPQKEKVCEGHASYICALIVLPGGHLASGSGDMTIKLWDSHGQCVATYEGHTSHVCSLAALHDGRLASGSGDNTIRVWDSHGKCVATLVGHTGSIAALAVLPDGLLASGSIDKTIKLWDSFEKCVATLTGHIGPVLALAALPNGRLASGSSDRTIKLWNTQAKHCITTLSGHTGWVISLATLHDGRLVSGSSDTEIKLWDNQEKCKLTMYGHTGSVSALAVLPNGRLASGSRDKTIKLWDTKTGQCMITLNECANSIETLAVLHDGRLASGSYDKTIGLWQFPSGFDLYYADIAPLLQALVGSQVQHLNCQQVQLTDSDVPALVSLLKLSSLTTLDIRCTFITENGFRKLALALANHTTLRTIYHEARDATLTDLADSILETLDLSNYKKQIFQKEKELKGHTNTVWALAMLSDGRVASGSADWTIKLWDIQTGECVDTLEGHKDQVRVLAVLPDGRLASGDGCNTIKLWDTKTGQCVANLKENNLQGWVFDIAMLPDGRLASGSGDKTIRLWDINGEQSVSTLKGHTNWVHALAVFPDGRLASGSYDNTIKLWDTNTGHCVAYLKGHTNPVYSLAMLPDGHLASGSEDKTIKLWDSHGRCVATLKGHADRVNALAVLSDSSLVSGSNDKTIKLWNIQTQYCVATLEGHNSAVYALALLPDGRLASGSEDKTIVLWQVSSRALTFFDIEPLLQRLANSQIRHLNCQQVHLTNTNISALITLLSPSRLSSLDIRNTAITEAGFKELVAGFANHPSLCTIYHETVTQHHELAPSPKPASVTSPDFSVSYILKPEAFTYGAILSQDGGYGIVYNGTLLPNIPVAIKQLKAKNLSDAALAEFTAEMSLLVKIQVHSKHTVRLYGCCLESAYAMVMEYMENGSLFRLLHSDKPLSWQSRYSIACDMANGIETLHHHNILHRDIKSLNVLLDRGMNAKWCDFGLAKLKTETRTTTTNANSSKGTLAWIAPEKLKAKPHTKASDIYSLGITFWELASRKLPYEGAEGDADVIRGLIKDGEHDDIPEDCPPKFAKLIQLCWSAKPEQRPTAKEVSAALQEMEQEFIAVDKVVNKTAAITSGPRYNFFDSTNSVKPASVASSQSSYPSLTGPRYGGFNSSM